MRRLNLYILLLPMFLLGLVADAPASDQIPAPPQEGPIALVNGRIHTAVSPPMAKGTVLFEDGKITAVGEKVEIPAAAKRIDIRGRDVYPAFTAVNTILGLVEIGMVDITHDYEENPFISPNIHTNVAVNPDSELIPVTRANGIAFTLTVPGGKGIKGMSSYMATDGWTWEDMTVKAPAALHIDWPRMGVNRDNGNTQNRDRHIKRIRDAFADARAYWKAKEAEKGQGAPYHKTDRRWEAMKPVLDKAIPVVVDAAHVEEIQSAVAWAEEEDIRLIIQGGQDAWRVAELLKEHEIPVIVEGTLSSRMRRWEGYDQALSLPAKLYEAGVKYCIGMDSLFNTDHIRNLPFQAGYAVAYGLPEEEAVRAITLYPARMFGLDNRIGSLEAGKDATLIVVDGNPLDVRSNIEKMYIAGRDIDLTSKHTQLYEKYKVKYEQLSNN